MINQSSENKYSTWNLPGVRPLIGYHQYLLHSEYVTVLEAWDTISPEMLKKCFFKCQFGSNEVGTEVERNVETTDTLNDSSDLHIFVLVCRLGESSAVAYQMNTNDADRWSRWGWSLLCPSFPPSQLSLAFSSFRCFRTGTLSIWIVNLLAFGI